MTASSPDIPRKLIDFIQQAVPQPRPRNLSGDTDLRNDLRLIWEDAEAVMARFFAGFSVDPGDFDLNRYFPREGSLLTSLLASLTGRAAATTAPRRLTIGMLCRAAEAGVWQTEAIEG